MKQLIAVLVTLLALASAPVLAQADVAILHGISGTAIGLDASLPVDIWVNGEPFLTNVTFGQSAGPVSLPAGDYEVRIFLAGSDPETNDPVLSLDATLKDGDSVDIVAHLTPGPGIALSAFTNNNRAQIDAISPRISERQTRLTVRHAADFPRAALNRLLGFVAEPTLANGETLSLEVDPGDYSFWVSKAGAPRPISFDPIAVSLAENTAYNVYAVGSESDGSFQLAIIARPLP